MCSTHQRTSAPALKPLRCNLAGIWKRYRLGRQEDAHEFLRMFIDGLQASCLTGYERFDFKTKSTTLPHSIFGGHLCSSVGFLYHPPALPSLLSIHPPTPPPPFRSHFQKRRRSVNPNPRGNGVCGAAGRVPIVWVHLKYIRGQP